MFWEEFIAEENLLDINRKQALGEPNLPLFRSVYLSPKPPQRSYRMKFYVYRDAHTHIFCTYVTVHEV